MDEYVLTGLTLLTGLGVFAFRRISTLLNSSLKKMGDIKASTALLPELVEQKNG